MKVDITDFIELEKTFGNGDANARKKLLLDAWNAVCDREDEYGSPEDNFALIADLWEFYLNAKSGHGGVFALDVVMMMILLKVARTATAPGPSYDSLVDIAGYAACAAGIIGFSEERRIEE